MGYLVNKTSSVKIPSYPYSVSGWAYLNPSISNSVYFTYYNKTSDPSRHKEYVFVFMSATLYYAVCSSWNGLASEARARIDPARPSSAGWHHVVGVFNASNDRRIYVDNAKATNGTNLTPSLPVGDVTARILCTTAPCAEVGVWDVALTDDDVANLYSGAPCRSIKPQSLVHYVPAVGSEIDLIQGGAFWSDTGANANTHPPIIGAIAT